MSEKTDRRHFLNASLLGAAGAGIALGREERILMAAMEDGTAGGAAQPPQDAAKLPCGKIGKFSVSRLIMGGNLIGGWAHSLDLMYVSRLFKAYNTEEKIFETCELAEKFGINTIQIDPVCQGVIQKYRKERGGKIQTIVCISPDPDSEKVKNQIKSCIDQGADMLYTHGENTDRFTREGNAEVLGKAIELMKAQGVPGGIGSHSLESPILCEKQNLNPDFYVKTLHMDRYWSATPPEHREEWCWYKGQTGNHDEHYDNMWCLDPEKTIAFMEKVEKPWLAFKVMAAGAIHPRTAFGHALRNGADFVLAGMFDFQVEDDVNYMHDALKKTTDRKRPWRG